MINLSEIKPDPGNPRIIKDKKFKLLVQSLKDFPKMMQLRPLVIDEDNTLKAGNQRLKALKELGYKEVPDEWIKRATDFSEEELAEFQLKDNDHAGEFDWEMLRGEYDTDILQGWGLDVPNQPSDDTKIKEVELVPYVKTHVLLSFPPEKMIDLQLLLQQIVAFSYVEYEQSNN